MSSTVANSRRGKKSEGAFRTISEVAKELDLQQHVLRFWETRFEAVQPLKRGGGRRYYRPEDVQLLRTIRDRLYRDGFTIKGVQRLLEEKGAAQFLAEAGQDSDSALSISDGGKTLDELALPLEMPAETVSSAVENAGVQGISDPQRKEIQAAIYELEALKRTLDQALESA